MSIEAVNDVLNYEISAFREKSGGSDGQRTYILLESGELCNLCLKNPRMQELGIEKISFQVYQLAEKKLFNMDFKVAADGGRTVRLHFPNKVASEKSYLEFFSEVENAASNAGAVGLATLANQAAVLSSRHYLPPDKSSAYLRCMDGCDDIEFELIKLLCYLACELIADKTSGS
jgi:hypothetical protein